MAVPYSQTFIIGGKDFANAGKASTQIKTILKQLGLGPAIVRRAAIACYEAEMNVVMYAEQATLTFRMTPHTITISVDDRGPGIPDIPLAMQEGYSTATKEMREMGFGAGMGLPNIRRNADQFTVDSVVGKGTHLEITIGVR